MAKICRLCFASESICEDTEYTSISKFVPFLNRLCPGIIGVSQDDTVPQDICSNCEFQIETAMLLQKRLKFTEAVWSKHKDRLQDTSRSCAPVKPLVNYSDLFLNCHECGMIFDYNGLQNHVEAEHGDGHVSECTFCSTLLGNKGNLTVKDPSVLVRDPSVLVKDPPVDDFDSEYKICEINKTRKDNVDRRIQRVHREVKDYYNPNPETVSDPNSEISMLDISSTEKDQEEDIRLSTSQDEVPAIGNDPPVSEIILSGDNIPNERALSTEEHNITFEDEINNEQSTSKAHHINGSHVSETYRVNSDGVHQKLFICLICGIKKPRKANVLRHVEVVHMKNRPSHENSGNAQSNLLDSTTDEVKNEASMDQDQTPVTNTLQSCGICGKSTSRKANILRHIRTMHPDITGDLSSHIVVVTQTLIADQIRTVPEVLQCCLICGKRTRRKANLLRHIQTMHPEITGDLSSHIVELQNSSSEQMYDNSSSVKQEKEMDAMPNDRKNPKKSRPPNYILSFNQHNATSNQNSKSKRKHNNGIPCSVCGRKQSKKGNLLRHMLSHKGFLCTRCVSMFSTEKELADHEDEYQSKYGLLGIEDLPCGACDKKFNSDCEVKHHAFFHYQEFKCRKCQKRFATKEELATHELLHVDGLEFSCSTCGDSFDTKSKLYVHKRTHKAQLCGICGEWVTQGFTRHLENHSKVKKYKCVAEGCGKGFHSRQLLKLHRRTHLKLRRHPCDIEGCGMSFYTKNSLSAHKKTHTGVKRYKCTFEGCTRAFHQNFDLGLHMRRHTGEKPYECEECNERFYTASLLRKHQESCNFVTASMGVEHDPNDQLGVKFTL